MGEPLALDRLEVDHARFNALKTVSNTTPSDFETKRFGELVATRDRNRPDNYYNRILGLGITTAHELDYALDWIRAVSTHGLRLDISDGHAQHDLLTRSGFQLENHLLWLHLPEPQGRTVVSQARQLTSEDWPVIRSLLQVHGPISDDLWQQKRSYLCTDTFRWFGIFDPAAPSTLVSAASVWTGPGASVLGSAYTRQQHRGQGYQRKLLDARIAASSGLLVVDVAPNSTSHRNCKRAGFVARELREVWTCAS